MSTPVKLNRRKKHLQNLIGIRGRILTWTVIRVSSKHFVNQAPYPVALVALDNGERFIGQVVDCEAEDLRSGLEIVGVLRRVVVEDGDGVISYGIKFRPAD